jgi:hypothetical protein
MSETFRSYAGAVIGATDTIVVPAAGSVGMGKTRSANSTAIIHSLFISNVDGINDIKVDVTRYDGTTSVYLGFQITIPAGTTLSWDKQITLETLEMLRVRTPMSGDIEVTASVVERV